MLSWEKLDQNTQKEINKKIELIKLLKLIFFCYMG